MFSSFLVHRANPNFFEEVEGWPQTTLTKRFYVKEFQVRECVLAASSTEEGVPKVDTLRAKMRIRCFLDWSFGL